jgi:hypothetical protein
VLGHRNKKSGVCDGGNLIANTITHEIGHSLGLAYFPEDERGPTDMFHNMGDNDGWIMDSGSYRAFEERAELDGATGPVWSPSNRDYLLRILPQP